MRLTLVAPFWFATLLSVSPAQNTPDLAAQPLSIDRAPSLEYQKLRQNMTRLANEHSQLVEALNLGTLTRGGRYVEALRVAGGERAKGRPAILIVANIDGPLVYTSGLALSQIKRLAEAYGNDERVTRLLDTTTLYFVPRANPDAAERMFAKPSFATPASGHGVDNDRDGREGEDVPEDLNGDGMITQLRVLDSTGLWLEDPTDPRVLIEADRAKGQRGKWTVWTEGRDKDGDEAVAEDPLFDAVVNRNFPQGWTQGAPAAGLFPTDEPEVRNLCEFILNHKDIQLVVVYGDQNNLIGKVKSVADDAPAKKRVPPSGLRESDAALLAELGKAYKELSEYAADGEGHYDGSFQAWCYDQRGLLTVALKPWAIPLDAKPAGEDESGEGEGESADEGGEGDEPEAEQDDAPEAKPSDDAKRLVWADQQTDRTRFVDWTAFDHPELGAVEIGGWAPFAHEPPPDVRAELAQDGYEFLLLLAEKLARVGFDSATAKDLGGGLIEVEATLINESFLPLLSTWGKTTRTTRPAKVQLHLPENATLLAGERVTLVSDLPGMGGNQEFRWLVSGAPASTIGISVETDHAGTGRVIPEEVK